MERGNHDVVVLGGTSMPQRVLDRLSDMLCDAADVLEMLRAEESERIRWATPIIQRLYDDVSDIMNAIAD